MKACYTTAKLSKQESDTKSHLGAIAGHVGRIYSDDDPFIETCYWAQGTEATNGIGYWLTKSSPNNEGSPSDQGITKVTGSDDSTWSAAMSAMNTALSDANIGWQYEENADTETKDNFPLVIAPQGN